MFPDKRLTTEELERYLSNGTDSKNNLTPSLVREVLELRKRLSETVPPTFGFERALELIKQGFKVRRTSWGGKAYVAKLTPFGVITEPFLSITTGSDLQIRCSWLPNQSDLFEEWERAD